MGYAYHFYVESRGSGEWTVPANFKSEMGYGENRGYFTWISERSNLTALFWGEERLFEMRREFPPERNASPLFHWLDPVYDYDEDEFRICWLPVEELILDCWEETMLLVEAKFSVKYAQLFGDGQQPFPLTALLQAGLDEARIGRLKNGRVVREPIDQTFGKYRFQLSSLPPEALAAVTWKEPISEFLGKQQAAAFQNLRQYGQDSDLRIITLFY